MSNEWREALPVYRSDTLTLATCLVENGRANRALEKLGAVHTGIALQVADPDGNVGDFKKWEFRKEMFAWTP